MFNDGPVELVVNTGCILLVLHLFVPIHLDLWECGKLRSCLFRRYQSEIQLQQSHDHYSLPFTNGTGLFMLNMTADLCLQLGTESFGTAEAF